MAVRLLHKILLLLMIIPLFVFANEKPKPTFTSMTEGSRKIDGYMPLYWDEKTGRMLMEVSQLNQEFLYQVSLAAGLGSNPIGLDRGQLGRTFVVYFERIGPKVFLVQPNYRYLHSPMTRRKKMPSRILLRNLSLQDLRSSLKTETVF